MISDDYDDLLYAPTTAILTSLLPDGSPQGSPVWFLYDGEHLQVSTTADRQKYRNIIRDPRVALTVVDPARPLRYLEVRGRAEPSDDTDLAVRDGVARKHGYADGAAFDPPGARRVTLTIVPTHVIER